MTLTYQQIETAGATLALMFQQGKKLAQDDLENPIPADNERILHEEKDEKGKVIGRISMTYLEKLEIWDFLTPEAKRRQLEPVKAQDRRKVIIDGKEYETNIERTSKAAKETKRRLKMALQDDKFKAKLRKLKKKH